MWQHLIRACSARKARRAAFGFEKLPSRLTEISRSPRDEGTIELIVRRPIKGQRELIDEGQLTLDEGLSGDCWKQHDPHPDMQINIMNSRAIALIACEKDRWALAGDQLYIDMDLSGSNLPPGTRIELGSALLEITTPSIGAVMIV